MQVTPFKSRAFLSAFAINFVWINLSETWRYFYIIKPLLADIFPGNDVIGAVTPQIFLSWMIWDLILILAACSFYWLYLERFGTTLKHIGLSAIYFTITVFGLIWLGVANMGFAPIDLLYAALPLAFFEQFIAAFVVACILKRSVINER